MENKISEYMEMEEEFEEMKSKFKYEDGRFLNNDRKDNEILILRSENSNIKKNINELEIKIKNIEISNEEKTKKINMLNEEIERLKIKIEEKQTELNLSQNFFYNITNNNNNFTKNSNNNLKPKCLLNEENNSQDHLHYKIKNYYKLSTSREKQKKKDEHNNTVKYYRNNINLHHCQFNKVKPKIFSYKKKHKENTTNNDKKSTKGNTNNNNDLSNTTRNEYAERLSHKFLSGNNISKTNKNVGKNNSYNKKKYGFPMNNSQINYGKYSYLFNKNNNINHLYSAKKIISNGSIKSSRPNSNKKTKKQYNNGFIYRSSSGE
jgi:hypothetical protein